MGIDHHAAALFAVSDQVRPNVFLVIKRLHDNHIETMMLTGDTEDAAWPIAKQVGIKTVGSPSKSGKKIENYSKLAKTREAGCHGRRWNK